MYAQAYFAYDSKKSGGVTMSHLRFGKKPIMSPYLINKANFISCSQQSYVDKYDLLAGLKPNGTFLLNTLWTDEELTEKLPAYMKRYIAENNINFYTVNAVKIAQELGLGGRFNMVMQSAFFKLANIIPIDEAVKYLKDAVVTSYGKKGQHIVDMNNGAIDKGIEALHKVEVPASWKDAKDADDANANIPDFIKNIQNPMNRQEGDKLPVSAFKGIEDGTFPVGTAAYEKRGIAIDVPEWDVDKCIQCNRCSIVCPHAVIRPTLLNEEEAAKAPEGYAMKKANGFEGLQYHLSISGLDCTGCGVCVKACPAKEKALVFKPLAPMKDKMVREWDFTIANVKDKEIPEKQKTTVKGSQFLKPYLEFSGACAGCGETPYLKLITQLFGNRMRVANSAGCTHIWGGSPEIPYCTDERGHGVAWASGLFEDTAEYGYGMYLGTKAVRKWLKAQVDELVEKTSDENLKSAAKEWADSYMVADGTRERADKFIAAMEAAGVDSDETLKAIYNRKDYLVKQSQWIVGGDGWAYDLGYSRVDHVIA